jgi:hypothetical protein
MTMDVSNFYLMTPLLRPKYIRIKLLDLPEEIVQHYDKVKKNGMVFLEVTKGMYGLPQSGLLGHLQPWWDKTCGQKNWVMSTEIAHFILQP